MLLPPFTTGLYDRRTDQVSLDEVEQSVMEWQTTRGNALGMPVRRVSYSDNPPD